MNARVLIAILLASIPAVVDAQTLSETGRLEFDADVEVLDFADPSIPVKVWERGTRETDVTTLLQDDPRSLTESRVLPIGGRMSLAAIDLTTFDRFEDRRVEVKLWYRAEGTDVSADLYWRTDPSDLRQRSHLRIPLQLTGRGTSDGWRELATGPIDWSMDGDQPILIIEDGTIRRAAGVLSTFSPIAAAPDARAMLDALSITDLGPAAIPDVACQLPTEVESCGASAVCYGGRCADARIIFGAPPLTRDGRQANVDRHYFIFAAFHAERSRHDKLPVLRSDLDAVAGGSPSEFYPGVRLAIRTQRFGHGVGPQAAGIASSLGICLGPGTADMLPGSPQLPLVFWIDSQEPAFDSVAAGDALVAIDGIDVATWQALDEQRSITPYGYYDEYLRQSNLGDAAVVRGSTLTFQRCSRVDGQPCDASELESYDIDTAELFGRAVRRGERPITVSCDLRFQRPDGFSPNGSDNDDVGVSTPEPNIKLIAFNGFYPTNQTDWTSRMKAAHEGPIDALIYDTRTGNGGLGPLIPVVTSPVIETSVSAAYPGLPDIPLNDANLRARLAACRGSDNLACLTFNDYIMARDAEADAPLSEIPVALLLGADGSGNDFFPLALQERSAPLWMLGSSATFGWFGIAAIAPFLDGELAGPLFQAHDSIRLEANDAQFQADAQFISDGGIAPDESCLQTQSDAIRGIDTCIGRAVEWLLNH